MDYIYGNLCDRADDYEPQLPIASTDKLGTVKIDGTTIVIDTDGTIHSVNTGTTYLAGNGININSESKEISVKINEDTFDFDENGIINLSKEYASIEKPNFVGDIEVYQSAIPQENDDEEGTGVRASAHTKIEPNRIILTSGSTSAYLKATCEGTTNRLLVQGIGDSQNIIVGGIADPQEDSDAVNLSFLTTKINDALSGMQQTLTPEQLAAINSGITAESVSQITENTDNIAQLQSDLDDISDNILDSLEDRLTSLNDRITSNSDSITAISKIISEDIQPELLDLSGNIETIDNDISTINSNISTISDDLTNIKNHIGELPDGTTTSIEQRLSSVQSSISNINSILDSSINTFDDIINGEDGLDSRISRVESQLIISTSNISDLQDAVGNKLDLTTGGTISGNIILDDAATIKNIPDPTDDDDAISKVYLEQYVAEQLVTKQDELSDAQLDAINSGITSDVISMAIDWLNELDTRADDLEDGIADLTANLSDTNDTIDSLETSFQENIDNLELSLNNKLDKTTGGTMLANIIMSNNSTVTNIPTPTNGSDVANKQYVDTKCITSIDEVRPFDTNAVTSGGVFEALDSALGDIATVLAYLDGYIPEPEPEEPDVT